MWNKTQGASITPLHRLSPTPATVPAITNTSFCAEAESEHYILATHGSPERATQSTWLSPLPGPSSASLAFLPVVSMALLVHLADGTEEMALRQAISMGQPGAALLEWLGELLPALSVGLPVLILAFGMVRAGSAEELAGRAVSVEDLAEKAENPENLAGKAGSPKNLAGKAEGAGSSEKTRPHPWLPRAAGLAALALSAVSLLFPALSDLCVYLIVYLLLAAAFSLWEKLHDAHPGLNAWGWILFGGFWLRAVERMLEIMSVYHL